MSKKQDRIYSRSILDQALVKSGICKSIKYAYFWILRKERSGKLTCPKDPSTGVRKFTFRQVDEIVNAFLPNGKGEWHYKG